MFQKISTDSGNGINSKLTRLSVVMPVFNAGDFLIESISSVLNQSFTDFEFIVIDDGSTDGSDAVIRKFAAQDNRIVVIARENHGLVASLNEGIARARSNFIARMDADDIAMPNRLHTQIAYLHNHPECVCVGSDIEIMDDKGRKLVVWHQLQTDALIQSGALEGHGTICHPSAMFRKDAFVQCGGYRAAMYPAEDLDLWLRLGEVGALANVDQVLLRYRMQPASISSQAARDGRQRDAAKRASDDACQRRGLPVALFDAHESWRIDGTAGADFFNSLRFGWWAYGSKEFRTAAAYGLKAWRSAPASREAFSLWAKSLWWQLMSRG